MANICSCNVTVTGPEEQLADFWEKMKAQDPAIITACVWFEKHNGFYCVQIDDACVSEDSISFQMDTKWEPKLKEIAAVSVMYPELTFEVEYEESGNNIYGVASIQDGVVDNNYKTSHDYYLENNEDYADTYELLSNPDTPWENCKDMLDNEEFEYDPYINLEHLIVAHIPVGDLPLYISHEWYSDEATAAYKARLSNVGGD